jgi:hypothetical protein
MWNGKQTATIGATAISTLSGASINDSQNYYDYFQLGVGAPFLIKDVATLANKTLGSALPKIYTSMEDANTLFPELNGVNPHYVENAPPGVNTNCVPCAIAADKRLNGVDLNAVATPSNGYRTLNDLLPITPFGFGDEISVANATATLLARGEGATAPLVIDQGNSVLHVITGIVRNAKVYWVDTQMNKIVTLNPSVIVRLGAGK